MGGVQTMENRAGLKIPTIMLMLRKVYSAIDLWIYLPAVIIFIINTIYKFCVYSMVSLQVSLYVFWFFGCYHSL